MSEETCAAASTAKLNLLVASVAAALSSAFKHRKNLCIIEKSLKKYMCGSQ
jgi:hypothetical protein